MSKPNRNWLHVVADAADPYFAQMSRREYWGLAGLALISIGCGAIYWPLAFICSGLFLIGLVALHMYNPTKPSGGD
ncbi:MAG: hypothetical protein V4719_10130 [Planctomycetota bacterium]